MSYHLIDVLERLGQPRILVLGDLILDRYVWGDAERVSQEAPVILLRQDREETRLGGAGNVANMLRGLDAECTMAGVVGADAEGLVVLEELQAAGIDCSGVVADTGRPTTVKRRYLGRAQNRHPHQILRVDREMRTPLEARVEGELLESVLAEIAEHQAVLISDYAKGVCTPRMLQHVVAAARDAGIPVIIDPAPSAHYGYYRGATAVTPNRLETKLATGREIRNDDDAFAAGRRLCADLDLSHAFITLDSDGMAVVMADGTAQRLATRKREVYDITGAGDMVLAMIGIGTAAGIDPIDLARLANVAGGLEVEQIGVVTISRQEILADLMNSSRSTAAKISGLDELARHVSARRKLGQRIVLTNGCFDVLHVGHVSYLEQAAREGDCLIVALNSDESVGQLGKGPDRPVFSESHRAEMLAALEAVDYVTIFNEATPHAVLNRLRPDLLVKGGTYSAEAVVGREVVEAYGGEVKVLGVVAGISTTDILNRLRENAPHSRVPPPHRLHSQPERKAG